MDWLTFIAALTKALAWPATVLGIAVIFRKTLIDQIPLLKRFKYNNLELDFYRDINELKADALKAVPLSLQQEQAAIPTSRLRALATLSPKSVVMEAWSQLEESILRCIYRKDIGSPEMGLRGSSRLGHALFHANLIDENQFDLFHRLRELRNRAAHDRSLDVSPQIALSYAESAERLVVHLDSVR